MQSFDFVQGLDFYLPCYTFSLILVILAIALPSAGAAWIAMKKPGSIKPIGLVLGLAVASGLVIWITAGSMSESEAELAEELIDEEVMEDVSAGPIFAIEILKDSAQEGNPDYSPDRAVVTQGHTVEWTNADVAPHTVTSAEDYGETFDSSLISEGETFTLDTTNLEEAISITKKIKHKIFTFLSNIAKSKLQNEYIIMYMIKYEISF